MLAALGGAPAATLSAHPLCGITVNLDTRPRTVDDGVTLDYTAAFCDVTGVDGGRVEVATFPVDPAVFLPGSAAWTTCPTGGCSIDPDGTLRIPAFRLSARGCVEFAFQVQLQSGQRGTDVCEQGAASVLIAGSSIPCDRPTDDPMFPNTTHETCVTIADPAPGCVIDAQIAPGFHAGCAGTAVDLSASGSTAAGCPGSTLTYRWSRDGTDLAGATAATYTVPASTPPSGASYRCEVGCLGLPACRRRSPATLVVLLGAGEVAAPGAACTGQPIDVSVPGGATCAIDCGNGAPVVPACVATCTYALPGAYTVSASSTDGSGCPATATHEVQVVAAATACIGALGSSICETVPRGPTHLTLPNCSAPGLTAAWSASIGELDDAAAREPLLTLPDVTEATDVSVTLAVSAAGCAPGGAVTRTLTLEPAPEVALAAVPAAGCPGHLIQFTASSGGSPGPLTYDWDFGDGQRASDPAPAHAYDAIGSYPVRLTVADAGAGCATEVGLIVPIDGACCWLQLPAVSHLSAVRRPTRADVSLFWDTPIAFEAYDIWAVASKERIAEARAPGGSGIDPVCLLLQTPACSEPGGAAGAPGTLRFYQVRGLCTGQEGP